MAVKKPDEYQHNNPDLAFVDGNFVRGGRRAPVADRVALYALAGKADQLRAGSTVVRVLSDGDNFGAASELLLVDDTQIGLAAGWIPYAAAIDKHCILVTVAGTRRYFDDYILASYAARAGDTIQVHGFMDHSANPFVANYANGTIWLAAGATLKAPEFYAHTPQLLIHGPGTMDTPKFSIEPVCVDFQMTGVTLLGRIVPYGFTSGVNGTPQVIAFSRCRIDSGAFPAFDAQYGNGNAYYTYVRAAFSGCEIKTTAASVFKYTDSQGTAGSAGAAANNRLQLVNNTIIAPATAKVVDDSAGAFTFEQGTNTYVTVAPPTKAASTNVVSAPGGSSTTTTTVSPATTPVYSSTATYAYPDTVQYDTPAGYPGGIKFWRWNNAADSGAATRPTPVSATNVPQGSWTEVSASLGSTLYTELGLNTNGGITQKRVTEALDTKVDKVTGKGLSTNDYSSAEATKLAGIAAGATAYSDEQAQDALAALLAAGTQQGIGVSYDDVGNRLSLAVTPQSIGAAYNLDVARSADFTVVLADRGRVFEVTTGAANITVTLPTPAAATNGFMVLLRKADTALGFVSVNGALLGIQGHTLLVWTDGVSWYNRAFFGTFDATGNLVISVQGLLKLAASAGVDFGTQKLLNVAPGVLATDGVTFGQLSTLTNSLKTYIADLDFGTADVSHTYLKASTLVNLDKSPGIATVQFSRNGSAFTTLTIGANTVAIAANDAFVFRVTYNATFTTGSLELKITLS